MAGHELFDENGFLDIDSELTSERDDRISPLIVIAAIAGLAIGLFLWGSLTMSLAGSAGDFFDGDDTASEGAPAAVDTITPTSTAEPEATITPTPDAAVNRLDCDEIRGTDYRSAEERTWFLANCVN